MRAATLLALASAGAFSPGASAAPPTLAATLAADATLHAVAPIDAERAWAVGDRGVLLRTDNGGGVWRRLSVPTDAPLWDVTFLDAQRGWAVGGSTRPYTHDSRGVVLRTVDGGLHWERVDRGPLPQLRSVRFFDTKHGMAAGAGSAFSPSGVYETTDGGKTWSAAPSSDTWRWTGGDFLRGADGDVAGLLVGARGAAARLVDRRVTPSRGYAGRRGHNAARLVDASNGWIVGDGGLLLTTRDGGRTWRQPPAQPPPALAGWFDWRAIEARGPRAWVVGSPGSLVLWTDDAGATWRTAETGSATPLHAVRFADDRVGWAVGEMGFVIATNDGGVTWRPQRNGDRRAALAFVVGDADELPAELIATNAAGEGNRSVVAAPFAPEQHAADALSRSLLTEAASLLGSDATSLGWRLPLRVGSAELSAPALLETLRASTDADPRTLLAEALTRLLITYRPEVVAITESDNGVSELLNEALLEAVEAAAQTPPPETRLTAWRPTRIVAVGPATRVDGANRFSTGDFSPLLGGSPAQHARSARGLLGASRRAAPSAFTWRHVWGSPGPTDRHGDLIAGLNHRRGGATRRPAAVTPAARLNELRRIAHKRRNMERLLSGAADDPSWAGQVVDLTGGLDAQSGAELLDQLANGYRDTGRLDLAAETFYLLARRYPDRPIADAALTWLVRYYASGERAHASTKTIARAMGQTAPLANRTASLTPPTLGAVGADAPLQPDDRRERANRLADFLEAERPALYADPSLRLAAAAASRARGYGADAEKTALLLSKQAIAADWRRAALAEGWLAKPEGLPPEKPIAACRRTPRRPLLDGELEDPAWRLAETIPLRPADESAPGKAWLACDDEFLFFAAEIPSDEPISDSAADDAPRRRDADLRRAERVRVRIDIDRDYLTAYELTIDRRGRTRDALWGDRHWSPTWWVAADAGLDVWRVEAAIPIAELVPPGELSRSAWAVSVEWLQPTEPTVSWTGAAASSGSPDAFGLLLFD